MYDDVYSVVESTFTLAGGLSLGAEMVSGLLFWLIIVTNVASERCGTGVYSDLDADAKLTQVNDHPGRFRISIVLLLIEHACIIAVAATLFVAFGSYNIILGVIWAVSRTGEALIQIANKRRFWRLSGVANEYSRATEFEKGPLSDRARSILKSKNLSFTAAQILFSIGTIAYSVVFVTSGVVPLVIGWSGIVAGAIYGVGNGVRLVRPKANVVWNVGGLLVLLFELALGGSLFLLPLIVR
jgi:hypothetical protein